MEYIEIKEQIKQKLPVARDLGDSENLLELGLSSLTIMRLVNQWRKQGVKVSFGSLMENPTLEGWWALIQRSIKKKAGKKRAQESKITPEKDMKQPFPLTDVQYAYWVGRDEEQALGGIDCHAYLEFDGENIEPERLEKAWNVLQYHHPMLRACFLEDGTQKIQDKPYCETIKVHDFSKMSSAEAEKMAISVRERLSHRKLKIEEGEVAGIELTRFPENKARLHVDMALLVADVQSLQILLRDLAAAYRGEILPAESKGWNFASYLERQKEEDKEERNNAEGYWKKRLEHLPKGPGLPLAKRPQEVTKTVFNRRIVRIGKEEWAHLQVRAKEYQTTPAMVLLTAYATVLERWSRNHRFLINIPFFNRKTEQQGLEEVIADFTTLLLLEINCEENPTFAELLDRIQRQLHEDMKYTAYSGVQVQRDLAQMYGDASAVAPVVFACNLGTPLVNDTFRKELGQFSYMISQTPQVWNDFQSYEDENGVQLTWDSVDELFPENMIPDMLESFEILLHELGKKDWNQRFDVFPERQKQFVEEQKKIRRVYKPDCIHSDFFNIANTVSAKVAIIDTGEDITLSYGELSEKALSVAAFLIDKNIKDQPIAISTGRGWRQAVAALGILTSCNLYVPVTTSQPEERRKLIHEKTGIQYVITDKRHYATLTWPKNTIVWLIEDILLKEKTEDLPKVTPEDAAYIIMTSGTTGIPKGAEIRHKGAWNTIKDVNRRIKITGNDVLLGVSALDFDLSVYDLFGILGTGGTLVMIPEEKSRDAEYWLQLVIRYQVTIWNSVPILLDMLLICAEEKKVKLPLKTALLSGDWIGMDLPQRLAGSTSDCKFIAMGGATEASIWSNYIEVKLPLPSNWQSIPYGRPLSGQSYRVMDFRRRDVPFWVEGELWIGGDGVGTYRGDEELVRQKFVEDSGTVWYRTGDKGRFWEDGTIEFLGREDFQVKIRGHRIELGEIETSIKSIDGIDESIVISNKGKLIAFFYSKGSEINDQKRFLIDNEEYITDELEKVLDDLGIIIIVDILIYEKCFIENGLYYTYNDLCKICKIDTHYKKLFGIWLNMLVKTGSIRFIEQKYYCPGNLIDIRDSIVKYIQDLSDSNIILKQIYELVINSEDVIRKIIQGCLEGTYTLEPNKYDLRPDKLNELFEQGQDYIAGIKNIIKQMSEENNRKINILEIGGYSKSIVNNVSFELGSYIEKYTYLSPKNNEMGKVDNVAFEIEYIDLDINNELFSYRCGKSKYDIVVAYQSIHCANNIDEAFKVIRKVLKSGGLLISVEPTRNSCFFNVVIGLLENNFNNYTDERSENEELLFDKQKWRESAIKAGLQEIATKNYGTMDKKVMFIWENKKELEEMFESEIKKILKKKLPNYMIPEFFVEMDVLPLSKNGKLDRKKVFSYLKECKFGRKDGTTATTYIEIEIVNILKDILKQNEVFMEDNFFQLGGDSLRAIKFKNSIQKRFNSNISIAQIFDSANIQEMVSKVEQSMLQNVEESIVVGDI